MSKFHFILRPQTKSLFKNAVFLSKYSTQVQKLEIPPTITPLELYNEKVQSGELKEDKHQRKVLKQLQRVFEDIEQYTPAEKSLFSRFFSSSENTTPKGLYIYGAVGGGKTMLMDLFYECCNVCRYLIYMFNMI